MAHTPGLSSGTGSNPFYHFPKSVYGTPPDGSNKVNLRAEIDTSLPFASVKEAVTHFESSGPWIHLHKLELGDDYLHNNGDIDMEKVEEQALRLEKDLIVKELETLDVLEELGTTKRMVEDLKCQLQKEALKCVAVLNPNQQVQSPNIGEVNKENCMLHPDAAQDKLAMRSLSPCPISSPDLILMELNQAKLNLGKTIDELGSIQTSVESLNLKIKKERALLEETQQRLTLKCSATLDLAQQRNHPQFAGSKDVRTLDISANDAREVKKMNFKSDQVEEEMPAVEQLNMNVMKTAEMKLAAAKTMEEAAKAAKAIAIAEIKALSGNSDGRLSFLLTEPDISIFSTAQSPLRTKASKMQKKNGREPHFKIDDGVGVSTLGILKKLEDAMEEVKLGKLALEEALHRVDIVNSKQLAAGEALRKWALENHPRAGTATTQLNHLSPFDNPISSPLLNLPKPKVENDNKPKPVFSSTVSMRDVLSRKQVVFAEDCVARRQTEGRKVALREMLNELREDITFPSRSERDHQKQFMAQRKKFGFIRISLPLTRTSRKNAHNLSYHCGRSVAIALGDMHECGPHKKEVKRFRGICSSKDINGFREQSFGDEPRSAFCFFMETLKETSGEESIMDIDRKGFEIWKTMSNEKRQPYLVQALKVNAAHYAGLINEVKDMAKSKFEDGADSLMVGKFDMFLEEYDDHDDSDSSETSYASGSYEGGWSYSDS